MSDITVQQLKERLESENPPELIDVREGYEHSEFNIGGRNLALGNIQSWKDEIEELKEKEFVLYCQSGNRSGMATAFLKAAGFPGALNLAGGVVAWKETFGE